MLSSEGKKHLCRNLVAVFGNPTWTIYFAAVPLFIIFISHIIMPNSFSRARYVTRYVPGYPNGPKSRPTIFSRSRLLSWQSFKNSSAAFLGMAGRPLRGSFADNLIITFLTPPCKFFGSNRFGCFELLVNLLINLITGTRAGDNEGFSR